MNEYEDYLEHGFFQNAVNGVRKAWGTATHNAPKYIKKIGNRYFYTQQELNAYLHKGMNRVQKGAEYLAQRGISAAKKDLHTIERNAVGAYNTERRNLSNTANSARKTATNAYNTGRRNLSNAANAIERNAVGAYNKGRRAVNNGISNARKTATNAYNTGRRNAVGAYNKGRRAVNNGISNAYNTGRRNLSNAANAVGAYNKGRRAVNNGISNIEREGPRIKNNTSRALNDLYTRSPEQNINALNRKLKKRRR